jgi:hypothetical protein
MAVTAKSATQMMRLVCRPVTKLARSATSAPKPATASAPPVCRKHVDAGPVAGVFLVTRQ